MTEWQARPANFELLAERIFNVQQENKELREEIKDMRALADGKQAEFAARVAKLETLVIRADTFRIIGAWVVSLIAAVAAAFSIYKASG